MNDSAGRPLGAPHILLDGQRIEVLDTPNDHLCLGVTDGEHSLLVTVRLNQEPGSVGWAREPTGQFGVVIPCPAVRKDAGPMAIMDQGRPLPDLGLFAESDMFVNRLDEGLTLPPKTVHADATLTSRLIIIVWNHLVAGGLGLRVRLFHTSTAGAFKPKSVIQASSMFSGRR